MLTYLVYDYAPYVTLDDIQVNSKGADISTFNEPELQSLLVDASVLADAFMQTTYQYQSIPEEKQNWRGDWRKRWEVIPYHAPIRTVSSFSIAVSAHAGAYSEWSINVTPVQSVSGNALPTVFGDVFVDREIGYLQTTDIMLKYGMGIAYIATPMNPPQVKFAYTCGFNPVGADITQYDNLNMPYPHWLIEGTRCVAAYLINERNLALEGMGHLDSLKVGDRSARRVQSAKIDPYDVPMNAQRYLKRGIRFRVGGMGGASNV